ncbi:hypothetical protein ILYODFUR_036873, partial [Ilyodon furcidens]
MRHVFVFYVCVSACVAEDPGMQTDRQHDAFGLDLPMAGGISKIEDADNDEEFQRVLQFAVIQHNNGTNDTVLHQVTKVLLAESQVVAGTNYIMTVILARTSCEKEGQAENCTIHKEPKHAQNQNQNQLYCQVRAYKQGICLRYTLLFCSVF